MTTTGPKGTSRTRTGDHVVVVQLRDLAFAKARFGKDFVGVLAEN